MAVRKNWLCGIIVLAFTFTIIAYAVNVNEDDPKRLSIDENTKFIIFDTDMGADDAWVQ